MIRKKEKFIASIISIFCLFYLSPFLAEASLVPEELVVLVNAQSSESIDIGKLYINLRKVPSNHLIKIDVTTKENISRKDYDEYIAGPVRDSINNFFSKGEKIRCIVTTYGIPLRINAIKPLIVTDDFKELPQLRNQKQQERAKLRKIKKQGADLNKELSRKIGKLSSEINQLNFKISQLNGSDTISAVDSELTLVLAPDYSLSNFLPNPQLLKYKGRNASYFSTILMVSRIDAPTPELARGLIRTSIEVEKSGLSGKVYLDARGKTGSDDYSKFDQDIRKTAMILQKSSLPVVLDNRPQVFQKGDAPEAALYCGWYSIAKYIDAFEWSKGAIGYHVASSEAVSIHNLKSKYWVKSMLEKSGNYTLAEVFTLSNPFLSWRIILIGDPLYNPFKNMPAVNVKNPIFHLK
jgi:uncharacterized protein (TIGR03790 family)